MKLKYTCDYPKCNAVFELEVGTGSGSGAGKHSHVSSQVKCPNCNNFLKTYGDKK